MEDPIRAFERIQDDIKRYITSAFGTNSETFEKERKSLLDQTGVIFQEAYVEPIPAYKSGEWLGSLGESDLPGMDEKARRAFLDVAGSGLFDGGFPLYVHQQRMLHEALSEKHCVVVTGTGSGKTESFLLPVLANIMREATGWGSARTDRDGTWTKDALPKWNESRQEMRGESRPAAVRALILYPMNALVEDQVSRLRTALDTDQAHQAMNRAMGGNRIRFGRYNGTTPVSGHPFKPDGKANSSARARLKNTCEEALQGYEGVRQKLEEARSELDVAKTSGDEKQIAIAKEALEKVQEQASFTPRIDPGSSEMFHRWEMQECPPDILITNVSMLSIMLMRHVDPAIKGDSADSQIFDKTREWLAADRENHVFQLVVDELHTHRGAAGTEVAYLLRLLLERLGLSPDSKQLRILASSASLERDSNRSFDFLGGFFGMDEQEAKEAFHVEAGELLYEGEREEAEFADEVTSACLELGSQEGGSDSSAVVAALDAQANARNRFLAGFHDERTQARAVSTLASRWFHSLLPADQMMATRGLFRALASESAQSLEFPRLRFHWMVRNVDGLWATVGLDPMDEWRRVGRLLPEPALEDGGKRVLEVLYCECCGTQLLCGNKIELTAAETKGVPHAGAFPGVGDDVQAYELTALPTRIDGLPEESDGSRTDARPYEELGVVWLVPEGAEKGTDISWRQGTFEQNEYNLIPTAKADANWIKAKINPGTGIVSLKEEAGPGELDCLWFHAGELDGDGTLPAMPQRCPACRIDYSERRGGRRAPIRSFVTGLSRTSHLLAKHMLGSLPEGPTRRLVAFSDSREAAARLADGVGSEQWSHLLRVFLHRELRERAESGIDRLKHDILTIVEEEGEKAGKQFLRERVPGDKFDVCRRFLRDVADALEFPDNIGDDQQRAIDRARAYQPGCVAVDDILAAPNPSNGTGLTPIWRDMVGMGENPGGSRIDFRTLGSERNPRDWTSVFDSGNGQLRTALRPDLTSEGRGDVTDIGRRLRKSAWRALTGRLFYDLEAQGLGYLCLPGVPHSPAPVSMDGEVFLQACNSVIRILAEERRTDPSQREDNDQINLWSEQQPTGGKEGIAKRRVYEYLSSVSHQHQVGFEELRGATCRALQSSGHGAAGSGWGVVSMSALHVTVVDEDAHPWICENCSQTHWHPSAGICARCSAPLGKQPREGLTAANIGSENYNAREATSPESIFRIHAAELTGQTTNQGQRQRHFRDVFFGDETVSDIGERPAYRNVDGIELLSVTTTMEVGVDIGSLQGIMQANMPPERFNYQQRAGRAGRKGQPFSAVLTYCRGQTHDRVHFNHPLEMTGGVPPQPNVTVGEEQIILAERLMAKEVLRRAFRESGATWTDSGNPPDTHGEMGLVEGAAARIDRLEEWLVDNQETVASIANVLCRGTTIRPDLVEERAKKLPKRIREAMQSGEFVEDRLAHRLAEAGILPMYGMPTNVRNLYFELPRSHGSGNTREARALARQFDQAVAEFVPGAERTWESRSIWPYGICGSIPSNIGRGWKVRDPAVGAAYLHLFCPDCRQLQVERADAGTLAPVEAVDWWDPSWLDDPPTGVTCPSCGNGEARAYVAVAPNAFFTDFRTDRPAGMPGNNGRRVGGTSTTSPTLGGQSEYVRCANAKVKLGRQNKVFRTNTNANGLFAFRDRKNFPAPNDEFLRASVEGGIWEATEENGVQPDRVVAITSPKVTDVLAIRMDDDKGLAFFDDNRRMSCRRAAWYSAATILQRAIALELDVDSLDIEIASVHGVQMHGSSLSPGAELYLADEHPNGAGIVEWASENFEELLRGCATGAGNFGGMGRRLRDAWDVGIEKPWLAPETLLRGFRNRHLHGLLDWRLGLDLLAVMYDCGYKPGLDAVVAAGGDSHEMPDWNSMAADLARRYVSAFKNTAEALPGDAGFPGWRELDRPGSIALVVHPLWARYEAVKNGVGAAMQWAEQNGMHQLRLVDSFNLSRRMAWVRGNLDDFPVNALDHSGNIDGADGGGEPPLDPSVMKVGSAFEFRGWRAERTNEMSPRHAGSGDWLAKTASGGHVPLRIRHLHGASVRVQEIGGSRVSEDDANKLVVIARLREGTTQ